MKRPLDSLVLDVLSDVQLNILYPTDHETFPFS